MWASQCCPGSPAGPWTAPAEPRPSETWATFPGAAAVARSATSASSLTLTAWWSWQLASLNFKPAFDPGCRRRERLPDHPPANSWLEPHWHQQPDSFCTLYSHQPQVSKNSGFYQNMVQKSSQTWETNIQVWVTCENMFGDSAVEHRVTTRLQVHAEKPQREQSDPHYLNSLFNRSVL